MVKRYPHIAIITGETGGSLVDGEWVEGDPISVEIIGRYDPVNTSNVIRVNPQGDEVVVRGEFYTNYPVIPGALTLEVPSLGIKRSIICWWPYQTHSLISV